MKKGFTFVEVIVTAVIVAALAAVAIPMYISYSNDAKYNAARITSDLIAAAVRQTLNHGRPVDTTDFTSIGMSGEPASDDWNYSFTYDAGTDVISVTAQSTGSLDDTTANY